MSSQEEIRTQKRVQREDHVMTQGGDSHLRAKEGGLPGTHPLTPRPGTSGDVLMSTSNNLSDLCCPQSLPVELPSPLRMACPPPKCLFSIRGWREREVTAVAGPLRGAWGGGQSGSAPPLCPHGSAALHEDLDRPEGLLPP